MQIDPRLQHHDGLWEDDLSDKEPKDGQVGAQSVRRHLGFNPQLHNHGTYDPQLYRDRTDNQQVLKRRFEHIFAKYERSFDGIGDEIDLATGDLVVNNGHIKNMRHEGDTGARTLQPSYGGDESLEVIDNDLKDSSDVGTGFALADADENSTHAPYLRQIHGQVGSSTLTSSSEEPDELALDLVPSRVNSSWKPSPAAHARRRPTATPYFTKSRTITAPESIAAPIAMLRQAVMALQVQSMAGQAIDRHAIETLGNDIDDQLAKLESSTQRPRLEAESDEIPASNAWKYPELPGDEPKLRTSVAESPKSMRLPPLLSPNRKSIWAPVKHPSPRKRRHTKYQDQSRDGDRAEHPALLNHTNGTADIGETSKSHGEVANTKVCTNCGYTGKTLWRYDSDRNALCGTCGMYSYRYGLVKPTEPFSESENEYTPETSDAESDKWIPDPPVPSLSQKPRFLLQDDVLLIKLKEIDLLSWDTIAKSFPGRSPYAVQCRYSKQLHGRSTEARSLLISEGYTFDQGDRGAVQALNRKGDFTEEEEDLLLKLRDENLLDWNDIAKRIFGRSPRSLELHYKRVVNECRNRENDDPFFVNVKPKNRRKSAVRRPLKKYTKEEDEQLVKLREEDHIQWPDIAAYFPGRSSGSLQKHYTRDLKSVVSRPGNDRMSARQTANNISSSPIRSQNCQGSSDLPVRDGQANSFGELQIESTPALENRSTIESTRNSESWRAQNTPGATVLAAEPSKLRFFDEEANPTRLATRSLVAKSRRSFEVASDQESAGEGNKTVLESLSHDSNSALLRTSDSVRTLATPSIDARESSSCAHDQSTYDCLQDVDAPSFSAAANRDTENTNIDATHAGPSPSLLTPTKNTATRKLAPTAMSDKDVPSLSMNAVSQQSRLNEETPSIQSHGMPDSQSPSPLSVVDLIRRTLQAHAPTPMTAADVIKYCQDDMPDLASDITCSKKITAELRSRPMFQRVGRGRGSRWCIANDEQADSQRELEHRVGDGPEEEDDNDTIVVNIPSRPSEQGPNSNSAAIETAIALSTDQIPANISSFPRCQNVTSTTNNSSKPEMSPLATGHVQTPKDNNKILLPRSDNHYPLQASNVETVQSNTQGPEPNAAAIELRSASLQAMSTMTRPQTLKRKRQSSTLDTGESTSPQSADFDTKTIADSDAEDVAETNVSAGSPWKTQLPPAEQTDAGSMSDMAGLDELGKFPNQANEQTPTRNTMSRWSKSTTKRVDTNAREASANIVRRSKSLGGTSTMERGLKRRKISRWSNNSKDSSSRLSEVTLGDDVSEDELALDWSIA